MPTHWKEEKWFGIAATVLLIGGLLIHSWNLLIADNSKAEFTVRVVPKVIKGQTYYVMESLQYRLIGSEHMKMRFSNLLGNRALGKDVRKTLHKGGWLSCTGESFKVLFTKRKEVYILKDFSKIAFVCIATYQGNASLFRSRVTGFKFLYLLSVWQRKMPFLKHGMCQFNGCSYPFESLYIIIL